MLHRLCVAWFVVACALTVALVLLWVRSYQATDYVGTYYVKLASSSGALTVRAAPEPFQNSAFTWTSPSWWHGAYPARPSTDQYFRSPAATRSLGVEWVDLHHARRLYGDNHDITGIVLLRARFWVLVLISATVAVAGWLIARGTRRLVRASEVPSFGGALASRLKTGSLLAALVLSAALSVAFLGFWVRSHARVDFVGEQMFYGPGQLELI